MQTLICRHRIRPLLQRVPKLLLRARALQRVQEHTSYRNTRYRLTMPWRSADDTPDQAVPTMA